VAKYITTADIIGRIGEADFTVLSDRDGDGIADEAVYTAAITDAEVLADSYVATRYALPLPGIISNTDPSANTVPPALVLACVDIAVYRMSPDSGRASKQSEQRFNDAVKWLGQLSAKQVTLGVETADTPATTNGGVVRYGPTRIMTREGLAKLF